MSKRIKINRSEGTPIDMSNWYVEKKRREEALQKKQQLERELEKKRVDEIQCPFCKSTDKLHNIKRQSNGIMGPGHSSWVTEDYLICKSCGIHYNDINKIN